MERREGDRRKKKKKKREEREKEGRWADRRDEIEEKMRGEEMKMESLSW